MTIEQKINQYQAELKDLEALGPGFAQAANYMRRMIEALEVAAKKESH